MKVGYLMLVHKNPKLLQRAINVLTTGNSSFFIHLDKKVEAEQFRIIQRDNVHFVDPISVVWGEYSQVEATLILIRAALQSDHRCDYFVFLQGSDYPLCSGSRIESFFEDNDGSEFISLTKIPAPGYPLEKINKIRYPRNQIVLHLLSRTLAKLSMSYRDYKAHLCGMQGYAGDACWALSRAACTHILDRISGDPTIEVYFKKSFTADEMIFHTILGNSEFLNRIKRGLVFRDWSTPGDHPKMLTDAHVGIFESQKEIWADDNFGRGRALFARKFSDERLDLIDRIDAMIAQREDVRVRPSEN